MLTYTIPKNLNIPIYEYLYKCIKADILNGSLKPKEKLPSKRSLSGQLKISLITVEHAYDLLLTEGYIYAIEKKGYYVESVSFEKIIKKTETYKEDADLTEKNIKDSYFPYNTWSKLTRKVLSDNVSLNPSPFNGELSLRKAIAKHLYEFHELRISPSSIIIGAGSEYLYSLLIQYFGLNSVYALENPGHKNISNIYRLNNAQIQYIDLDDKGLDISKLDKTNATIVHISPAHHFPSGITMPLKRRMEILNWARKNNGYIIEDDYDSEFRINSRPIPPLYQLDNNDRVIYMNTFSKSLSSSFRIAYMVLPDSLVKDFEDKLGFYHNTVSSLDQKILAEFINGAYFERHLNRKRKIYRSIHNQLMEKMKREVNKYDLNIKESESGLHFILEHHFKSKDKDLSVMFKKANLPCTMLSDYLKNYEETGKIVVNYSGLNEEDIDDFISKLDKVFAGIKKNHD